MDQGIFTVDGDHSYLSPKDLVKFGFPDLSDESLTPPTCGQIPPLLPCSIDGEYPF